MQQNLFSLQFSKIIISIVLLFGSANIAFAEESGAFFGIGIGGGLTTLIIYDKEMHKDALGGGINYEIIDGYKHFFTPTLGLRGYINLDLHQNLARLDGANLNSIILTYTVNADFLWNFITNESFDFGLFIGTGYGGNTITGKSIKTNTGFAAWYNAGLRANINTNHGLEIAARVGYPQPFSVILRYIFSIDSWNLGK